MLARELFREICIMSSSKGLMSLRALALFVLRAHARTRAQRGNNTSFLRHVAHLISIAAQISPVDYNHGGMHSHEFILLPRILLRAC